MILPTFTALLLLAQPQEQTSSPDVLRVGHVVELRGALDETGRFVAARVTLEKAGEDEEIIGTVADDQTDPREFILLGQPCVTDEDTDWEEVEPGESLAGKRIEVEGSWKGPRKFTVEDLSLRSEGRDRITGRLDEIRRLPDGWIGRVMIFDVFIPDGVLVEHELSVADYELAEERIIGGTITDGDYLYRDEDDAFGEGIELTDTLRLQGQLEVRAVDSNNFDLRSGREEDRTDYAGTARIRLTWEPRDNLAGLLETRYSYQYRRDDDNGVNDSEISNDLAMGEAWLQWRDVGGNLGFDLTVGRQDFDDEREWIFDQNLDALRATWIRRDWRLDLSTATIVSSGGERDEESWNGIAYLSNNNEDQHLAAWTVYRDIGEFTTSGDLVPEEESLHFGVRAVGDWFEDQEVWADFAYLIGTRPLFDVNGVATGTDADVSAWAYDVGTTWSPDFADPLYFSIGYALGSGSGDDGTFRQTGWQDNNNKFGGVTSFRYYGELFDPELSNMGILTAGVGARIAERTSLDLVVHTYTQDEARAEFSPLPQREANIRQSPNGIDADLGFEADLILGMRKFEGWDLEIVAATFRPGDAFDFQDNAYFLKFQLRYRF